MLTFQEEQNAVFTHKFVFCNVIQWQEVIMGGEIISIPCSVSLTHVGYLWVPGTTWEFHGLANPLNVSVGKMLLQVIST